MLADLVDAHPVLPDHRNLRPKRNIKTAMAHEMMLYGCAQKEVMGLDKAVEECSASMPATTNTVPFLTLAPFASQSTKCLATVSRPT